MLTEFIAGPPGMPPFTEFILHKIWEVSPTTGEEKARSFEVECVGSSK